MMGTIYGALYSLTSILGSECFENPVAISERCHYILTGFANVGIILCDSRYHWDELVQRLLLVFK